MDAKVITVVGGDKRNVELAKMLARRGHTVRMFGFSNYEGEMQYKNLYEAVNNADCIIGPIPCSHNGNALNVPFHNAPVYVEELFRIIKPHQLFLAGIIKPELLQLASKYSIHMIDILTREELLVRNAIPTAEGAIKIAIEETDITLHNNQMYVIGYGRVGRVLAKMLDGLGAKVVVVVNKSESAALAETNGIKSIFFDDLEKSLKHADVIFNTVPTILLDSNNMKHIRKDTLIIDLASPPYGVDVNDSRDFGLKVLYASSLPGKIAPITTASYLLDTVLDILAEVD